MKRIYDPFGYFAWQCWCVGWAIIISAKVLPPEWGSNPFSLLLCLPVGVAVGWTGVLLLKPWRDVKDE